MRPENPEGRGAAASAEQRWEARVLEGLAAFRAGRIDEAYAAWRSAAAIRQGLRRGRPAPGGQPDPSRPLPCRGRRCRGGAPGLPPRAPVWEAAEQWVARMAVPQRARSSGFHLRMETKHRGSYDALARAGFARLLNAGRAAAHAGAAHLARNPAAVLEDAQEKRAAGLSWRDADRAAILRALATLRQEAGDHEGTQDARQRAEAIERDPVGYGPERLAALGPGADPGDLRRLEAAVYLTPVVPRPR